MRRWAGRPAEGRLLMEPFWAVERVDGSSMVSRAHDKRSYERCTSVYESLLEKIPMISITLELFDRRSQEATNGWDHWLAARYRLNLYFPAFDCADLACLMEMSTTLKVDPN